MKLNCWEYNKCGRELYGQSVNTQGVCPAAVEEKLNGIHGGKNAGRACWVIAGTYCNGVRQGTFAQKYNSCKECDFYQVVKSESGDNFQLLTTLIQLLLKPDKEWNKSHKQTPNRTVRPGRF